jgi:hypothetical protein
MMSQGCHIMLSWTGTLADFTLPVPLPQPAPKQTLTHFSLVCTMNLWLQSPAQRRCPSLRTSADLYFIPGPPKQHNTSTLPCLHHVPVPAVTCAAEVPVFEVTGWLMSRLGPDVLLDVVVGCYMLRMLVSRRVGRFLCRVGVSQETWDPNDQVE